MIPLKDGTFFDSESGRFGSASWLTSPRRLGKKEINCRLKGGRRLASRHGGFRGPARSEKLRVTWATRWHQERGRYQQFTTAKQSNALIPQGLCDKVVVGNGHCGCDGIYSLITSRQCEIMHTSMFSFVIMCILGSPTLFMSTLMCSSTVGIKVGVGSF